jgi:hypothetical protein
MKDIIKRRKKKNVFRIGKYIIKPMALMSIGGGYAILDDNHKISKENLNNMKKEMRRFIAIYGEKKLIHFFSYPPTPHIKK